MSREAVANLNQCNRVWDRPRWGGFMRFEDAAVNGRIAQILLKDSEIEVPRKSRIPANSVVYTSSCHSKAY
jgi:hypothetical protein